MARIRTIKPEFWRNEDMSSISPEAALLAIGLLNHADDEGYFNANPKLIEADVFPLRELSVSTHTHVKTLEEIGYLQLFSGSDGRRYGKISNFTVHQKINRPNQSKIKGLRAITDHSVSAHGSATVGKERERNREEKKIDSVSGHCYRENITLIFDYWKIVMKHNKAKLDSSREKIIKKSLLMDYTIADLKKAIDGCAVTPHNMGKNETSQVYDSLGLIFRNSDNIERFIKNSENLSIGENQENKQEESEWLENCN